MIYYIFYYTYNDKAMILVKLLLLLEYNDKKIHYNKIPQNQDLIVKGSPKRRMLSVHVVSTESKGQNTPPHNGASSEAHKSIDGADAKVGYDDEDNNYNDTTDRNNTNNNIRNNNNSHSVCYYVH